MTAVPQKAAAPGGRRGVGDGDNSCRRGPYQRHGNWISFGVTKARIYPYYQQSGKAHNMKSLFGYVLTLLLMCSSEAWAADCDKALVKLTTSYDSVSISQLSIAWTLDEASYNERRKGLSATATIYGVPVGANYSDFRKNIQTRKETYNFNNFETHAIAYASSKSGSHQPSGVSRVPCCERWPFDCSRPDYKICLHNLGRL